jgi:hypothetical protein
MAYQREVRGGTRPGYQSGLLMIIDAAVNILRVGASTLKK